MNDNEQIEEQANDNTQTDIVEAAAAVSEIQVQEAPIGEDTIVATLAEDVTFVDAAGNEEALHAGDEVIVDAIEEVTAETLKADIQAIIEGSKKLGLDIFNLVGEALNEAATK